MHVTRSTFALLLVLSLLGAGCVSKSDYEKLQAELAACQEDKTQAEAQVITWEQRFDTEAERWNEMESSISDALPKALSEFHEERDRIVEMVPEQVQEEVNKYLDDYFSTVMQGFNHLMDDNAEIKMQLDATEKALTSIGEETRSIRAGTDELSTSIDGALATERSRRHSIASQLAEVTALVVEFDGTRINCKKCPEKLKLNRKEREAISGFHAQLLARLSALQATAGTAGGGEGAEPAADAGADG